VIQPTKSSVAPARNLASRPAHRPTPRSSVSARTDAVLTTLLAARGFRSITCNANGNTLGASTAMAGSRFSAESDRSRRTFSKFATDASDPAVSGRVSPRERCLYETLITKRSSRSGGLDDRLEVAPSAASLGEGG